jgi:hypothetical protein
MPLAKAFQLIALPQGLYYVFLAPPSFFCVITTFVSILAHLVKVSQAYGLNISLMHVENMTRAPFNAIPHVLVMGPYLCILVWHAIKSGVNLFKLALWGLTMVPHPFKPHAFLY